MTVDPMYIVTASVGVVGVVEWLKNLFPRGAQGLWTGLLPGICTGVAIFGGGDWTQIGTNALVTLAVSEMSYPILVQLPKALVDKFRKSLG